MKRSGSAFGEKKKKPHLDFFSFPDSSEDLQRGRVNFGSCSLAHLSSISTLACLSLLVSYFYNFVYEASGVVSLFLLAIFNRYTNSVVISFLQIPAQASRLQMQNCFSSPQIHPISQTIPNLKSSSRPLV